MSWETQGRQGHGWFGHGTGPGSPATRSDPTGRSTGIGTLDQRIGTVVGSLLGHFSRAERNHAALRPEGQAAAHIAQAMRVWVAAARLGGDALDKALPETTSDAMASKLREAALLTVRAHDPASLNEAGAVLASAAGTMGLDRWGRFAAEAAHAATAAMAASTVLRTAVIGFEEGAALGVETGPGALLTGLAGAVVGAGIGYYLSGPARPDLFTSPRPPEGGTEGQTPAQSVAGGAAGAPAPAQVPAQNPGFAATQGSPANTVATPADAPKIETVVEARKVSPEEAAKQQAIIKGRGLPTEGDYPYIPPKTWHASEPLPRGPRNGYLDADGAEWVRAKGQKSGTEHWDVQTPGGHLNVGEDGMITHGTPEANRLDKRKK